MALPYLNQNSPCVFTGPVRMKFIGAIPATLPKTAVVTHNNFVSLYAILENSGYGMLYGHSEYDAHPLCTRDIEMITDMDGVIIWTNPSLLY